MSYFWDDPRKPPIGLKADIDRHRKEKVKLEAMIEAWEGKNEILARNWRHFRCQLEQSLADLVSKLGKKNEHK